MKRLPARKIQKKKKFINRGNKKVIYRTLLAFSLFIASLVFLGGYLAYQRLTKSFALALESDSDNYSAVSDQFPTMVYAVVPDLKSDPLIISDLKYLIFDKVGKRVLVYNIPVEYKYDIAGKFGEEQLSKTIALGSLNSDNPLQTGTQVLKSTVLKIFGFKVDKFLLVDQKSRALFDDMLGNGSFLDLFKLKDFFKVREDFKTDLTLEEFYNLFTLVKSVPNDRLFTKTLKPEDLVDSAAIDTSLEDISMDSYLSGEGKSIAVLNGTDVSGIAQLGTRIVQNLGGRIVALGNTDRTYSASMIIADDVNSQTCSVLSRVFNVKTVAAKSANFAQEHEVDRSDIVVIIGFDTAEKLY